MTKFTLADLKRLPVGTELRLVECLTGEVGEGRQGRRVAEVRSNALVFTCEAHGYSDRPGALSWLHFPKASEVEATADGFLIREDGEVAARYVYPLLAHPCGHCGMREGAGAAGLCLACYDLADARGENEARS